MRTGRAAQQRVVEVAGSRSPRTRAAAARPADRTPPTVRSTSAANFPGRSSNGPTTLPRNCSARATYQNPSQVSGLRRRAARRPERPGPQRQLQVDERDREHERGAQPRDEPRPAHDVAGPPRTRTGRSVARAAGSASDCRPPGRTPPPPRPAPGRAPRPPTRRAGGGGSPRARGGARAPRRACRCSHTTVVSAEAETGHHAERDRTASAFAPDRPSPPRRPRR